jgi:hypothetical protein
MQQQPHRAADECAVDTDVLQVPADFQFHFAADFFRIPTLHDLADQAGDLVPEAHHDLVDSLADGVSSSGDRSKRR